ncbi:MAG: phage portal protein [Bacteroidales bacterium]|nr:phage portal protein [Bacteroidales bacterium]
MAFRKKQKRSAEQQIALWLNDGDICVSGFTPLDQNPEVVTAARKIAELVGMLTIQIMENTEDGDKRIVNELSRKLDIDPNPVMTRKTFIEAAVMNLLIYGKGNSIVQVNTHDGYIGSLYPVPSGEVSINPLPNGRDYTVMIDGKVYASDDVLHFRINPDKQYPWKGRGLEVLLKDLVSNLKQASVTEKAFFSSKWKPSLIIKVDAMTEEFSSKTGREKLLSEYVETSEAGQPWVVPAEALSVEQVKPLTLSDLALADNVQLDKRTVAAILGVPAFLLGVGDYNKQEWNSFVNTTIKSITMGIQQEMTKKLILSPNWYVRFNILSLLDWDIQTISTVFCALADRGFVTGNEVRDKIGMSPREGLNELRVLENYIPNDMSGLQKKLIQEGE